MDSKNKKLAILGGGEVGSGTAVLAKKLGFEVFVSDNGKIAEKYLKTLAEHAIYFEEEQHDEERILSADLVMKSPGIPDHIPLIKKIKAQGIPVIAEIEFAWKHTNATIVGITGTNGKTTTTTLVHLMLKNEGMNAGIGGNIGDSFALQAANENYDYHSLEISSFQLDGIVDFKPHIAILTNITKDHLDRYEYKFEKYIESKFRITENQTEVDYFIYDGDDEVISNWLKKNKVKAKMLPFSLTQELKEGAFVKNDQLILKINGETREVMNLQHMMLKGRHNRKNALAAALATSLLKVGNEAIKKTLEEFVGVQHRLENVLTVNEVTYINDSKATSVDAAYYALESMTNPTVWVAGGIDKGNDYEQLMPLVKEKVKAIVCLGVDNKKIIDAFKNVIEKIVEVQSAEDAVKASSKLAEKGDTVLLSPACASFDLFNNFEDRGQQFKEAVKKLQS
jgi:UDP-N-acetylmuramoylalanine--D-glutamate ligase